MAGSIASFYSGAKVCHIEAGLRTHNKQSPFPEEINRQVTGRICDYHFAPTETSKNNLLKENISEDSKKSKEWIVYDLKCLFPKSEYDGRL